MDARPDIPTAMLVRIPVLLDYPEDVGIKFRRKLWYLPAGQRVVVS